MCEEVRAGVRQGYKISPLLFVLAVDWVMTQATSQDDRGIYWNRRQQLHDLDFADDNALISNSLRGVHFTADRGEQVASSTGLTESYKKSNSFSIRDDYDVLLESGGSNMKF
ncbi:uncharacterized protein [Penaeus vannamei]|uniref:uncharacterized protein n=1 Tax=Penaeus vannamei TaxID=6689 RepID=UPI00387F5832